MSAHFERLAGHFTTQRGELPDDVRVVVDKAYWCGDWDSLSPTQRMDLAWQYDIPESDAARLDHIHQLIGHREKCKDFGVSADTKLQQLDERIETTRQHLLTDQMDRAKRLPTPTEVERVWQTMMIELCMNELAAHDCTAFDPEGPLPGKAEPRTYTPPDHKKLAAKDQLIDAFGVFTGMDQTWFRKLSDAPALLAARRVTGQGGRAHIIEPLFCPYAVMQWLISSSRRKGRELATDKGWQLFERNFPSAYASFSVGDPRSD